MTVLDLAKHWAEPSRILVVEDGASSAKALKQALALFNCAVQVVSSLHEAASAVGTAQYDMVFVDFNLPNGVDVVKAIKRVQPSTPVLAVVETEKRSLEEIMGCGTVTLLRKSIDLTPQHLRDALAMFKVKAASLSQGGLATATA